MTTTEKMIRDKNSGALVSKDAQGLAQRKRELENLKRIEALESSVNSIESKIDLILRKLSG